MKKIAKWFLIIWSLVCLFGVFSGITNVSKNIDGMKSDSQKGAAGIAIGCGMTMWVGIWLALAGPALIIYLVSGKKEPVYIKIVNPVEVKPVIPEESRSILRQKEITDENIKYCKDCGSPYQEGKSKYCSNCGNEIG